MPAAVSPPELADTELDARSLAIVVLWSAHAPVQRAFALAEGLTIGRGDHADVCLGDLQTSRHHAEIRFRASRWILRDAGSTHGTFVNGTRIHRPVLVEQGAIVRVGQSVLRFGAASEAHEPRVQRLAELPIPPSAQFVEECLLRTWSQDGFRRALEHALATAEGSKQLLPHHLPARTGPSVPPPRVAERVSAHPSPLAKYGI